VRGKSGATRTQGARRLIDLLDQVVFESHLDRSHWGQAPAAVIAIAIVIHIGKNVKALIQGRRGATLARRSDASCWRIAFSGGTLFGTYSGTYSGRS